MKQESLNLLLWYNDQRYQEQNNSTRVNELNNITAKGEEQSKATKRGQLLPETIARAKQRKTKIQSIVIWRNQLRLI